MRLAVQQPIRMGLVNPNPHMRENLDIDKNPVEDGFQIELTLNFMPATTNITDPFGAGSAAYNLAGNNANSNLAASGSMIQLSDIINATNRAAQTAANDARLGPQGVATQNNLLTNAQNESAGLLDPQTEQMLQQGIAAGGNASGMGVDSANLAASYRRALGQTINSTEQQGQTNYLNLLSANPSAPIYDMSGQLVNPQTYAGVANSQANLAAGGGSGGGGGGRVGGGNPVGNTPAQNNNVPSGGGYAGPSGNQGSTSVNGQPVTGGVQYNPDGSVNYNTPWTYQTANAGTGNGASLVWSGQDWTGLFGDPNAGSGSGGDVSGGLTLNPNTGIYDYGSGYTGNYAGGTGTTGNLGDLGLGTWYQPTTPDYSGGGGSSNYGNLGDYYGP